ncbi:MAG: hypothetical protein IH949_13000 [Bacteroidetes bacterium]|nr:hypothetical protein [Bacteroidota bacterium]
MLDTVIGPVTGIVDSSTFEMNVTHIGKHNKFQYTNYEKILVAENNTKQGLHQLNGRKVRCLVKYRDEYNRLYADVELG